MPGLSAGAVSGLQTIRYSKFLKSLLTPDAHPARLGNRPLFGASWVNTDYAQAVWESVYADACSPR
jgi:hypothetical protein